MEASMASIQFCVGFYGFYGALYRRSMKLARTINKGLYYGFYASMKTMLNYVVLYRYP